MANRLLTGDFAYIPTGAGPLRIRLVDRFATAAETFMTNAWLVTPAADGTFSLSIPVPDTGTARYVIELPDRSLVSANIGVGPTLTIETLITANTVVQPQNVVQATVDSALTATVGTLSNLTTTAKTTAVAAINELRTSITSLSLGASGISDSVTGTATTWSSSKVSSEVGLVAATVPASTVRFISQTLTVGQQTQARTNIGALATTAAGDTEANLVALFETALV